METCREFENLIDRARAGELPEGDNDRLLAHLEVCESCSELFDLLAAVGGAARLPLPGEAEFAAMRRAVIDGLGRPAAPFARRFAASGRGFRIPPALAAALALALLGGGLLIGLRLGGPRGAARLDGASAAASAATGAGHLASEIRAVALRNERFEDVENSPFIYSNVGVEASSGDRLHLSFDVSRHLDLELAKSDPLVSEILVQALVESSTIGTRIQAIDLAGELPNPKVKQAIIMAMRHDPNLGVRLSAQAKLAASQGDPEIGEAMLAVLEKEPSVQMRLAAIEYLTRNHVRPEALERAIGAGPREGEGALYVRANSYLRNHDS